MLRFRLAIFLLWKLSNTQLFAAKINTQVLNDVSHVSSEPYSMRQCIAQGTAPVISFMFPKQPKGTIEKISIIKFKKPLTNHPDSVRIWKRAESSERVVKAKNIFGKMREKFLESGSQTTRSSEMENEEADVSFRVALESPQSYGSSTKDLSKRVKKLKKQIGEKFNFDKFLDQDENIITELCESNENFKTLRENTEYPLQLIWNFLQLPIEFDEQAQLVYIKFLYSSATELYINYGVNSSLYHDIMIKLDKIARMVLPKKSEALVLSAIKRLSDGHISITRPSKRDEDEMILNSSDDYQYCLHTLQEFNEQVTKNDFGYSKKIVMEALIDSQSLERLIQNQTEENFRSLTDQFTNILTTAKTDDIRVLFLKSFIHIAKENSDLLRPICDYLDGVYDLSKKTIYLTAWEKLTYKK